METSSLRLCRALWQARAAADSAAATAASSAASAAKRSAQTKAAWPEPKQPTAAQLEAWSELQLDIANAVVEDKSLHDWDLDPSNYDKPKGSDIFAARNGGKNKSGAAPTVEDGRSSSSSLGTANGVKKNKKKITLLGGVDISFPKAGGPYSCAALIVLRLCVCRSLQLWKTT